MTKLSIVLATRNEEENIGRCLESVKDIADEIVVMDEFSTDRTVEIAESYGAKVFKVKHEPIFHKTKQKVLEKAVGDWILQLDADEVVTAELAKEIKSVVGGRSPVVDRNKLKMFRRHQGLVEKRDGSIGKRTGEVVGYFIPRRNMFLGKPLIHAGAYPDGVIRLVKKGKAGFPAKSVHEQIFLDGEVAWLFNGLEHHDTPTLRRYFTRMNRYTDLQAQELKSKKVSLSLSSFLYYIFFKPLTVFLNLYLVHKGFLDGVRGFLWSLLSSWHFPLAYFKYWTRSKK